MLRAVATVSIAAIVLGAGAWASPLEATTVFRDTTGEEPAGPDITTVTVWSDGYQLAFRFPVPTSPVVTPDMRIRIWLDADDSLETGLSFESGPTGLDHFIVVDPTRFRPDEAVLYRCAGSTCFQASYDAVAFTYASGASFAVDAPALGLKRVARLRFSVSVYVGIGYGPDGYDFTNARVDLAPDANDEGLVPMWTYAAQPLAARDFRGTPARPQAGKAFALTMRVQRSDTRALLTRGTVTCSLHVGGIRAPARTSRFVGRRATCLFDVPTGTTGRRFRATIGVAAQGAAVRRSLSGRVE